MFNQKLHKQNEILWDACTNLSQKENIDIKNLNCQLREKRSFSQIYEILCDQEESYILKIDTTNRKITKEFNIYQNLESQDINTLHPILYSEEYNYLITKKKNIISLEAILKSKPKLFKEYLISFAKDLSKLTKATGKAGIFEENEYSCYFFPRLEKCNVFSKKQKEDIRENIQSKLAKLKGSSIFISLVYDVNFGNVFFDERGLVILDMGDAEFCDHSKNIALIHLNICNEFLWRNKVLMEIFLQNYSHRICNNIVLLYVQMHLLNMILFSMMQADSSNHKIKKCILKKDIFCLKKRFLKTLEQKWN